MDKPEPKLEHQRLWALEGEWLGEETLSPSPWGPGGAAIGRSNCRLDVDGFFVIQDYTEETDGQVKFRGHGIFGYDPGTDEYCWYWVDSMGFVPAGPSRGRWEGDTLTFHSKGAHGDYRYIYRFDGDDRYHLKIESSADGGETYSPLMEGSYTRQS